MLPHPLVPHSDSDNCGSPVANESLSTSIEYGLATNNLGPSAIDLDVMSEFVAHIIEPI